MDLKQSVRNINWDGFHWWYFIFNNYKLFSINQVWVKPLLCDPFDIIVIKFSKEYITITTISKAFLRSTKTPATDSPLSNCVWMFLIIEKRALFVEQFSRKLIIIETIVFFQKSLSSLIHWFSFMSLMLGSREIGLQLLQRSLSSLLKSGTILAILSSVGNTPSAKDFFC